MYCLIVTGQPCTGKTTIGKRLAHDLSLPFISKDGIKEILFDALGIRDRVWSKDVGRAAYRLLFYMLEQELRANSSVILEANFPATSTQQFRELQSEHAFQVIQVLCHADDEIVMRRFRSRSESGERHPGHVDHLNYAEMQQRLSEGPLEPLALGGSVIRVNTNDFARVDYDRVLRTVREEIEKTKPCR